jgi:hypothetical protein
MAAQEGIPIGTTFQMVQNTIYALPASRVLLFCTGAPTLQQSTEVTFTASAAVTLAANQAELAGAFLRCTSAGPQPIILKKT